MKDGLLFVYVMIALMVLALFRFQMLIAQQGRLLYFILGRKNIDYVLTEHPEQKKDFAPILELHTQALQNHKKVIDVLATQKSLDNHLIQKKKGGKK